MPVRQGTRVAKGGSVRVIRIAIRRPVTVFMAVTAFVLFGAVSLGRLAFNLLPEISYPSLTIHTDLEDSAPQEVEALVTRPVEEAVGMLAGVKRISSISRSGQSEVVLEFGWDAEMEMAAIEVREKLDFAKLPPTAKRPLLLRFDPRDDPIMHLHLHGALTLTQLRDFAERELKQRIESLTGVAAVKVTGGRDQQIRIEVDERQLAELGIPITQVTDVLRQGNLNQASGSLYDLDSSYMVRVVNEFRSIDDIRETVIDDRSGRKVKLRDVSRVWRGSRERDIIVRFNGSESVAIAVYKTGGANTVAVSQSVRDLLDAMREEPTFPQGIETSVVLDQAKFITASVTNVLSAGVLGGILAAFVLFVFLRDARSTGIIAASIPVSVFATFAAMYQAGISLNIMSLGGVALGIGMLVDNSIVVLEAVHRHRRSRANQAEAVYQGASEVAMPVTASTFTTVAVFLPLVFVEGVAGQLFRDQALTITFSLLASLVVALTLIPMLLSVRLRTDLRLRDGPNTESPPFHGRGGPRRARALSFVTFEVPRVVVTDVRRGLRLFSSFSLGLARPFLDGFDSGFRRAATGYSRLLALGLDKKAVVFGTVLVAVAVAAAAFQFLGAELIPPLAQGEFWFEVRLPQGRSLEFTDEIMHRIESEAQTVPGVGTQFSIIGTSKREQFSIGALDENVAILQVILDDRDDAEAERQAIGRIRALITSVPEVEQRFSRPRLFSFKPPIVVEIFAHDLADQRAAAELVAARLARIDGVTDIETTTRLGDPEVRIRFDRHRLSRFGLQEEQVASVLRNKILGAVATRYRESERQIDILVRIREQDRNAVATIGSMVINSGPERIQAASGTRASPRSSGTEAASNVGRSAREGGPSFVPIRLDQVADIKVGRGPAEIRRIRSQRAAVVEANLGGRDLSGTTSEIREALAEISSELPVSAIAAVGGQNEELELSFTSLGFAMSMAIFLVYLVMASQFESLVHPLVILLTVPLGLVGGVYALALTGTGLSVVVLLGSIVLAGIAVNNAIVLVDFTNRLREQGVATRAALIQACQMRLRPILMTSLTTLLGLVPMAVGWGEGDEVRAPMAIAVIGGILSSTLVTLIVVPVVYELTDTSPAAPLAGASGLRRWIQGSTPPERMLGR